MRSFANFLLAATAVATSALVQGVHSATVAPPTTPNLPPVARCKDVSICLGSELLVSDIDNGSSDPDGTIASIRLSFKGPFTTIGRQRVSLIVKDNLGAKAKCRAKVTIKACTPPVVAPIAPTVVAPPPVVAPSIIKDLPVSLCNDIRVCVGVAVNAVDLNNGSFDPLGGLLNLNLLPCGPFDIAGTVQQCVLSVTNALGLSSQCIANVEVVDCPAPAPAPKSGCLLGLLGC